MSYRLSFWHESPSSTATSRIYMNRAQAIHAMRKHAYEKLANFGKLDTQAAHDVMNAIDRCDDILQPQEQRNVRISNTGYFIAIINTKRVDR